MISVNVAAGGAPFGPGCGAAVGSPNEVLISSSDLPLRDHGAMDDQTRYAGKQRFQVQYFVRTTDVRKDNRHSGSVPLLKRSYPELACSNLDQAIDQAKRSVLESDKTIMLRADACSRNMNQVRTKYRCWIDERGAFNELALA